MIYPLIVTLHKVETQDFASLHITPHSATLHVRLKSFVPCGSQEDFTTQTADIPS
ncbi:hypothetical protein Barb4_01987 [Bacteroidales bacterium Barb4]|nr:hypothetical protein Barb4_01987 [Bacteroidales bacterium Barb4]